MRLGRIDGWIAFILAALLLTACAGSPASRDRTSSWSATAPAFFATIEQASNTNPSNRASATPAVLIAKPSGPATEGVVTDVHRYVASLDRLISGKEPTIPNGPPPFGFFLDSSPRTFGQGMETNVLLDRNTRIARKRGGRLVPATAYDLELGQHVAFWGPVAESYPGHGHATFVLIKDEKRVGLAPARRPDAIHFLAPAEGGETCPQHALLVELLLNDAMREDGFADPSKVKLELDGRDVTSKAKLQGTVDMPQSMLQLSYQARLQLGPHKATLTYRDPGGDVRTYTWRFNAEKTFELGGARSDCEGRQSESSGGVGTY